MFACKRALGTFSNKAKYTRLRENAFKSVMDGAIVSEAWAREFYRLRNKVFVNSKTVSDTLNILSTWSPAQY